MDLLYALIYATSNAGDPRGQVHWHARAKVGKSNLNQRRRGRGREREREKYTRAEKSGVLGHRSASYSRCLLLSCLCSLNPVLETNIPSQIFKLLFTTDFRGVPFDLCASNYILYTRVTVFTRRNNSDWDFNFKLKRLERVKKDEF